MCSAGNFMPGALSGMSIQKEGASMTIGQKIRMFRKERHLTLRELGELAGFPNRGDVRIAQYENGSRIPKVISVRQHFSGNGA